MEAAAGLIGIVVKFASRVEGGHHHPRRRDALLMHLHRDAPAVVPHRAGAIRLQSHPYLVAVSRQVLVHGIVHNLVNQMVEPLGAHPADVHARALADCLQALQHRDAGGVILFLCCIRHSNSSESYRFHSSLSCFYL